MKEERRKHKRLPAIKGMSEPIELVLQDEASKNERRLPGVLTNLSAGGMDLVLLGPLQGKPNFKLNMHLPGFDRFEVEGRLVWSRPKESTAVVGIQFTKIDKDHAHQLTHMAEAFWECEDRIRTKAPNVCFHGCTYWDLCEKPVKLKHPEKHPDGTARR